MVCQRLQIGQALNLAARVVDLDYIASTSSELAAEYRVMASIYRAKLINVVPGSTEQRVVVREP
jgi:hypothetical protein